MSLHGECRSYFMSEEERQGIIRKYGPPMAPLGSKAVAFVGIHELKKNQEPRFKLTKKEYIAQKHQGRTDEEICREYKTTGTTLRKYKRRWNLPDGRNVNWNEVKA